MKVKWLQKCLSCSSPLKTFEPISQIQCLQWTMLGSFGKIRDSAEENDTVHHRKVPSWCFLSSLGDSPADMRQRVGDTPVTLRRRWSKKWKNWENYSGWMWVKRRVTKCIHGKRECSTSFYSLHYFWPGCQYFMTMLFSELSRMEEKTQNYTKEIQHCFLI